METGDDFKCSYSARLSVGLVTSHCQDLHPSATHLRCVSNLRGS
jgi:hypothetical protein